MKLWCDSDPGAVDTDGWTTIDVVQACLHKSDTDLSPARILHVRQKVTLFCDRVKLKIL